MKEFLKELIRFFKKMLSNDPEVSSKRAQSFGIWFLVGCLVIALTIYVMFKGLDPKYIVEVILGLGGFAVALQVSSKIGRN